MIKCQDISFRSFMLALFNQQYEGVGGIENWELVYTEFVDISGIGETAQFELLKDIHNVQLRITKISGLIEMQRNFFGEFKQPFTPAFTEFKRYGHRLVWNAEKPEQFLKQLDAVESREKQFVSELDGYEKELEVLKTQGLKPNSNTRADFVRQKNRLEKHGFKIDKDDTDMEEYGLMIREYNEEIQQLQLQKEKQDH